MDLTNSQVLQDHFEEMYAHYKLFAFFSSKKTYVCERLQSKGLCGTLMEDCKSDCIELVEKHLEY